MKIIQIIQIIKITKITKIIQIIQIIKIIQITQIIQIQWLMNDIRIWSNAGMTLTVHKENTWSLTCPIVHISFANLT